MEGFKTINVLYPSQINLVRGESSLLFFMHRNNFGLGVDQTASQVVYDGRVDVIPHLVEPTTIS